MNRSSNSHSFTNNHFTMDRLVRSFAAGLLIMSAGCSRPTEPSAAAANVDHGCIQSFDPARDYFPEKAHLEFAKNFSVEYHPSYKVVTIYEASQGGGRESYVLLQCGAPKPQLDEKLRSAMIVPVPIESLFSESSTHHQALIDVGRVDVITGVAGAKYVIHKEVVARIRAGKVVVFGPNGSIDAQRVISSAPAILMSSRNDDPAFPAIRNGGVPVIANTEWLDHSALGRAEWIKFIALFLNEEERAEAEFARI